MSSFENDMKDAFEGVEFKPSEKLWAGIESAIVPKKKKGIFFMWQTYGMAASLLLAIGFAFLWSDGFFEANNTGSTESLTEVTKEEDDDSQDDVAAD